MTHSATCLTAKFRIVELENEMSSFPVVFALLLTNGLIFAAQTVANPFLITWFALWPLATPDVVITPRGMAQVPDFRLWQLVSYAFLHGGMAHLFFNMFALWMFGAQIERTWGSRPFLIYYFVCVIGAALVQLVVASLAAQEGGIYPTLGASGGVFGILLAFGVMFPEQPVYLIFFPVPIKAKYFVVGYGAIELWAGITGTQAGVAHFAHLGGMLFGFLLIQYWRGRLPIKPRRRMLP